MTPRLSNTNIDWNDASLDPQRASEYLFRAHFKRTNEEHLFSEHLKYAHLFEKGGCVQMPAHPRKENGKIRIGYLSPDIYGQASHYVLLPIIAGHDKSRFEIYVYATHSAYDDYTREIQKHANAWRIADHNAYDHLRNIIVADQIDILIDLAGHTGLNSLPTFALRAAPVQVSWFGYMDTTGLSNMDYRFTDVMRIPKTRSRFYSEKLIYLSNSYSFIPYEKTPAPSEPPSRRNGYTTYGSLNSSEKIDSELLLLWSHLLRSDGSSRLCIMGCPNFEYARWLQVFFGTQGIDPSRIATEPRKTMPDFLASLDQIDIALDPFPYTGGVTTYHALSMGVPTITLEGRTEYERNCSAIMKEAGLPDCVATTNDAYVAKAISLSRSTNFLSALRTQLPFHLRARSGQIVPEVEESFIEMVRISRERSSR